MSKKKIELMRKDKALKHTKKTLKKAEAHVKKLESEAKLRKAISRRNLKNARLESARLARTTQKLEKDVSSFQNKEKTCEVFHLDHPSVAAMRKCGHVFCQNFIKSVAKMSGNQNHIKCPYCNGAPDRFINFVFIKIIILKFSTAS